IEKAMLFLLPTNVAQALVIAVAIVFAFTMPITAPQVLWVNMVTSVALGLVISFEPHEIDVMRRPPRAVSRPIVTGFGIWRIAFVGLALLAYPLLAFFWMKSHGASDPLARTVAVNAITIGQVFYLLNSRYLLDSSLSITAHLDNPYLPVGIGAVVILQLLFTYAPPLQAMFGNEAIPLWVWPWLIAAGLAFFLVVEAEKLLIRSTGSLRRAVTAIEAGASVPPRHDASVQRGNDLSATAKKVSRGAPRVMRQRLESSHHVDARHRLGRGQGSVRNRPQRLAAVGALQVIERFGAARKLDQGLFGQGR